VWGYEYSLLLRCVDQATDKYERVGICGEKVDSGKKRFPWGDESKTFCKTITLV
jgi:hypothetical protein